MRERLRAASELLKLLRRQRASPDPQRKIGGDETIDCGAYHQRIGIAQATLQGLQ